VSLSIYVFSDFSSVLLAQELLTPFFWSSYILLHYKYTSHALCFRGSRTVYIFRCGYAWNNISIYLLYISRADLLHIFTLPSAFWPFRKKHVHADIDLFSGWVRHLTTTSSNLPCKLNKESVR
jgi:hypothetical protein